MRITGVPIKAISIFNHALDLSTRGDYSSALNEYKRAIDAYPPFIEAYNNIGEIYSKLGEKELAKSTYKRALSIDRNFKLLLNLGVEYYNENDFNIALNYFQESVLAKPYFIQGNFYTGITFFNLKDLLMAEKHFSRVIQFEKRHLKANYLLSYIYYSWNDYTRTLLCLDNIWDIADDKAFMNRYYGFCHYHLGKYDEAVKHLSIAIEANPKYHKFKDYLKNLTYENRMKEIGNIEEKIKDMETKMMNKKPSMQEYTQLSILYIYRGDYKRAEDMLTSFKKDRLG